MIWKGFDPNMPNEVLQWLPTQFFPQRNSPAFFCLTSLWSFPGIWLIIHTGVLYTNVKVPSKWTTFWMSSLLTDCFTVKELKVRNSAIDSENDYFNCTVKMYRARQGPALVTDLLKGREAVGKGLQNAWGVKWITRPPMIGLICPLRG